VTDENAPRKVLATEGRYSDPRSPNPAGRAIAGSL
jgi:hypothetical protein